MDDTTGLAEVLERSRRLGFLGPGPIDDHLRHAQGVLRVIDELGTPGRALDLGSGGGVPGLVIAVRRPEWTLVLLDAQQRRTDFLVAAVRSLGVDGRVSVVRGRAEDVARDPVHRGAYDVVVARSFGPPAVTAECGAGFLAPGGHLVVSEPPDPEARRWPTDGLAGLGLVRAPHQVEGWACLHSTGPVDAAVPRANGRPAKRPLWA